MAWHGFQGAEEAVVLSSDVGPGRAVVSPVDESVWAWAPFAHASETQGRSGRLPPKIRGGSYGKRRRMVLPWAARQQGLSQCNFCDGEVQRVSVLEVTAVNPCTAASVLREEP